MNIAGRGEGGRNKVDSGRETKEGNGCKQLSRRAKPLCLYFDFMKSALLFFSLLFSSLLGYRRYVHVHDSSSLSLSLAHPLPLPLPLSLIVQRQSFVLCASRNSGTISVPLSKELMNTERG